MKLISRVIKVIENLYIYNRKSKRSERLFFRIMAENDFCLSLLCEKEKEIERIYYK